MPHPDPPRPSTPFRVPVDWLDEPEAEHLYDRITRELERLRADARTSFEARREAARALHRVLARYDLSPPLAALIDRTIAPWR